MKLLRIQEENDKPLADIIRHSLKANGLDIPGTVYFDPELDHLSGYYLADPRRDYYVAVDEKNQVAGGIGLDAFSGLENCAELQKLYLTDQVRGHGYGYEMIDFIKTRARALGYHKIYLETHHNLAAAIHMYQKCGFQEIERLPACVHSTMDHFFVADLK